MQLSFRPSCRMMTTFRSFWIVNRKLPHDRTHVRDLIDADFVRCGGVCTLFLESTPSMFLSLLCSFGGNIFLPLMILLLLSTSYQQSVVVSRWWLITVFFTFTKIDFWRCSRQGESSRWQHRQTFLKETREQEEKGESTPSLWLPG